MTEEQLVTRVFEKEGDTYGDQQTTPPIDQPTGRGGIVLDTLRAFVVATKSPLPPTVETLKTLTHAQAREIVRWVLRRISAVNRFDDIGHEPLRLQMIDFAYNSGPALAVRWLQRVLGVPRTGRMDASTIAALKYPFDAKRIPVWIHMSLVAARLEMVDMWSDPDPARPKDANVLRKELEEGLENRVLSFSLLEVP